MTLLDTCTAAALVRDTGRCSFKVYGRRLKAARQETSEQANRFLQLKDLKTRLGGGSSIYFDWTSLAINGRKFASFSADGTLELDAKAFPEEARSLGLQP